MPFNRFGMRWLPHLCGVLVVCWFWSEFALSRTLRANAAGVLAAPQRPSVVNGLLVRLDRYLGQPLQPPVGEFSLLFATSDSCSYSKSQVDSLLNLIRRGEPLPSLILVSLSSKAQVQEPLVRALSARHISYQQLTVADSAAFSEDTGLAWTPAILLLDRHMRVRLVTERLTPTVEAILRDSCGSPRVQLPTHLGSDLR